jgi:hypothetical protein
MNFKKLMVTFVCLISFAGCLSDAEITKVGNPTGDTPSETGDTSSDSGDTSSGSEDTTFENTVNSGTRAITQVPALDLSSADSTQTLSLSALEYEPLDDEKYLSDETLDILVEQTAPTSSTKAGDVEMFQCSGGVQDSYVSVSANNTSVDVVQYSVRMINRSGVDLTFVGDTNGLGTITGTRTMTLNALEDGVNYSIEFTSNNNISKMAAYDGSTSVMCVWDTNGNGCGKSTLGNAIPFSFTTAANGERTYSASTNSLCDSLPDAVGSIAEPEGFTSDRTYECDIPANCTTVTPGSAIELEDAGGTQCENLGNHWATASDNPSTCSDTSSVGGIGCNCDAFYALATQMIKNSSRSGLCKVMGLANNGDIDMGERDVNSSVCIQDLEIGN